MECYLAGDSYPCHLWISEDGDAHREFPLLASTQILGLSRFDFVQIQVLQYFGDLKEAARINILKTEPLFSNLQNH